MNLTKWFLIATFSTLSINAYAAGCPADLPESARAAVEQDNWKILDPFDLQQVDAKIFRNNHQGQCPGIAMGNFYPRADSSYLIALVQTDDKKNLTEKLVLVTQKKGRTDTSVVVPPTQVEKPSVVWKLVPGHYVGIDGTRAHISRDSFIYEQVNSTATQYYYDGSHLKSFVISR